MASGDVARLLPVMEAWRRLASHFSPRSGSSSILARSYDSSPAFDNNGCHPTSSNSVTYPLNMPSIARPDSLDACHSSARNRRMAQYRSHARDWRVWTVIALILLVLLGIIAIFVIRPILMQLSARSSGLKESPTTLHLSTPSPHPSMPTTTIEPVVFFENRLGQC